MTHGTVKTWYRCKLCKRSYGRVEDYRRHLHKVHPEYVLEPEVLEDQIKEMATAPVVRRPFESLTKDQLNMVKFRTVPAKGITASGPASTIRPIMDLTLDLLKEDLQLSDDSSDTASMPNSSESGTSIQVDYKALCYQSSSTSTLCLDELSTM